MRPTLRPARSASTALRGLVASSLDPMAWALLLAGLFDGMSDSWVHAVLLFAAAVAVGRDAWYSATGRPTRPSVPALRTRDRTRLGRRRSPVPTVLAATAAAGYGIVAGAFERYTWPDTVAILVPATVVLLVGWRGPLRARPVPQRVGPRSLRLWSAVLVTFGLWELSALLLQPSLERGSWAHPTISFLMESVLATHAGRTVTLLAWLALGWGLLTQVPGADPREQADDLA